MVGPHVLWFNRYSGRKLFRSLGYTSDFSELGDDEAEWFKAVDRAYNDARETIRKIDEAKKGKGRRGK